MERTGARPGVPLRAVRAAVFTTLCVTLSTTSHVLLTRTPVALSTLVPVGAAVFALAYVLADRERGFRHIAGLLVPVELAADTVFTTGQHTCYGQAGGPVTGPLRSVGVDLLCRGGELGTPLARDGSISPMGEAHPWLPVPPAGPAVLPWLLLIAHVAVGLLAAAWLWRGDAALEGLLRAVPACAFRPVLLLASADAAGPFPVRRQVLPVRRLPLPRPLFRLGHCVVRRGPPLPVQRGSTTARTKGIGTGSR
ncbi:hypothetical protein A6A06_11460 [Streptomyces sp. CB02923]|uniref:hypothetical protein n=1 Tax=Streptomyces sp. CB02923 TaxID=1718985 RepID=UPI00093CA3D1|nr:hypothetical protein [Streptomyces sp. CB02923]OKI05240.1 hypothetical protein A6A06_11460 [Streptomyces sp. CB02923]